MCFLALLIIIIVAYARAAAEGEAMPAIVAVGRVDTRSSKDKIVCITKTRRISPGRPFVTVATDIDVPATERF